jgi:hypothetical protein
VLTEVLSGRVLPRVQKGFFVSDAAKHADKLLQTVVAVEKAGETCYFDAGGFHDRSSA